MSRNLTLKSPLVGVFRRSSGWGRSPFVRPGERVEPETVICTIEVLSIPYTIRACTRGVVLAVSPADGEPVEYGEALFEIRVA